jgi:hypothetical protein
LKFVAPVPQLREFTGDLSIRDLINVDHHIAGCVTGGAM